jgi:hypothetical protein
MTVYNGLIASGGQEAFIFGECGMSGIVRDNVHRKTVSVTGGREFVGRFSLPPTDGARAS